MSGGGRAETGAHSKKDKHFPEGNREPWERWEQERDSQICILVAGRI